MSEIVDLVFKWQRKLVGVGKKRSLYLALRSIYVRVDARESGNVVAISVEGR